ncbi:ABC-type transport auxiliary lipoprotein family protein [Brevundimonas sp.]|uniref:ABC-type transport auxiliary lipoprotein family protein n=1 Tax=Brevundimonas sp. TaxID=1871086 RepID=UPI0025D114B0|nr:ABC-type transport auxiliary lipoprotein family protein [Brevundimonas sp.]
MIRRALAVTLVGVLASACALLSSPDPVQLYRFGAMDPPASGGGQNRAAVVLAPIEFPSGAEDDRILTSLGGEVAYLAGARWISPADDLYQAALEAAFLSQAGRVRLADRLEVPRADVTLDLDLMSFEARYVNGPEAAPTVVLAGRARLMGPDRSILAERIFRAEQPAGENRVSAIVAAFDAATGEFNRQVVSWVDGAIP